MKIISSNEEEMEHLIKRGSTFETIRYIGKSDEGYKKLLLLLTPRRGEDMEERKKPSSDGWKMLDDVRGGIFYSGEEAEEILREIRKCYAREAVPKSFEKNSVNDPD